VSPKQNQNTEHLGPRARQRIFLSTLSLAAYLLAFHVWGALILAAPGLLALSLRELTLREKCVLCALWGLLMEGAFHLWTLPRDPFLWFALLLVRGLPWAVFPLPSALLKGTLGKDALAVGAGLGLVTWLHLAGPSGLDWETPAAALTATPLLLATLPWIGLSGFSTLTGLCSALLFSKERPALALGVATLTLWAAASAILFPKASPPFPLPVALIQTGWPEDEKWASPNRELARKRLGELTAEAHLQGARLIIWPETAWPLRNLRQLPNERGQVASWARQRQVEILASSLEETPSGWFNSVTQITPTGRLAFEYRKRRLLPFQEYLPLPSAVASALRQRRWIRPSCHYLPGEEDVVFQSGGLRFAVLICYESTIPDAVTRLQDQVDFFLVVTNDAPLYSEWAREAHFRSAILRAAQSRKPFLQAANTGVTGVISAGGVVLKRTPAGFTGPVVLNAP
jgi:apolipoprotein N-acyltransferase